MVKCSLQSRSRQLSNYSLHLFVCFIFQTSSHSDVISPPCQGHPVEKWGNQGDGQVHSRTGVFGNSRWSTLSWDASSDLLSPPTLDSNGMIQMDSDSRPSSGMTLHHNHEHISEDIGLLVNKNPSGLLSHYLVHSQCISVPTCTFCHLLVLLTHRVCRVLLNINSNLLL